MGGCFSCISAVAVLVAWIYISWKFHSNNGQLFPETLMSGHVSSEAHNLTSQHLSNFCTWELLQMLLQTWTRSTCVLSYQLSGLWCRRDHAMYSELGKSYYKKDKAISDTNWCWHHIFSGSHRLGTAWQGVFSNPFACTFRAWPERQLSTCTWGHKRWDMTLRADRCGNCWADRNNQKLTTESLKDTDSGGENCMVWTEAQAQEESTGKEEGAPEAGPAPSAVNTGKGWASRHVVSRGLKNLWIW